ncbi:MAG: alpha/beta hydrolase [Pseudomonadota bacterium]
MTSQVVERAGAQLYVEIEGSGEPVLMLHGGLGHMGWFVEVRAQLVNRGRRVVLVDTRGMGRSSLGAVDLSYGVQENDAYAVLDATGVRACPVIGFSDGGIVGYRMAASANTRVSALVTIGSRWSAENGRSMWESFDSWDRTFFEASDFQSIVEDYDRLNPDRNFDRMMRQAAAMWKESGPNGHPETTIEDIAVPVLLVVGDDDPFLSVEDAKEAKSRIENAELLVVPAATHDAFRQRPDIFNPALDRFLASLG